MKTLWYALLSIFLLSSFGLIAHAQVDEIVVTAIRKTDSPGVFIDKKGDFLLLEIMVENDSREFSTRTKEMNATIDKMISAAANDPDITLSLIDDSNFVRPLSKDVFNAGIRSGVRPDTSIATLKVKTDIPEQVGDSYKLAQKLAEFVDSIDEVGRTKIINSDDISVSIINPYQYRDEVRQAVLAEIKETTAALGPDYRVVLQGLDGPVHWTRSGDLNLAFYMNYEYIVVPTSLKNLGDY